MRRKREQDAAYAALAPQELARIEELQQQGRLQFFSVAAANDPHWVGSLFFRAATSADVRSSLESLPLYPYLDFTIQEAARV